MPEFIGSISIPENDTSLIFPLPLEYPLATSVEPEVVAHVFNTGDRRITQRFLIGANTRRFKLSFDSLRKAQYQQVVEFFESVGGPWKSFLMADPETGTNIRVRFVEEGLTLALLKDCVARGMSLTVAEVPTTTPSHSISSTVDRFPSSGLNTALLGQAQEIIPLVRIIPQTGSNIYLSDRRVTVGGQLYQPRLKDWTGIGQSANGESDQADFVFANADRVFTELTKTTNLFKARVEFSLFHVGTTTKLNLWAGDIQTWAIDSSNDFKLSASDGIWETRLTYPARKITRSEGIEFEPETVYLGGAQRAQQDNSRTSRSIIDDNAYGKPLQDIYMDDLLAKKIVNGVETTKLAELPVHDCQVVMYRDENEFHVGLGIVGSGEITEFGTGHTLNGQPQHGPGNLGLRLGYGYPAPVPDESTDGFSQFFGLSETGDTYDHSRRAPGVSFIEVRATDEEGKQLRRISDITMRAYIKRGIKGWVWNGVGSRSMQLLSNPVWIAINMLLKARGVWDAEAAVQEQFFDVDQAIASADFCEESITKVVGSGSRKRFQFRGIVREEKELKQWLTEVLNSCLGGFTFRFGKFTPFLRSDSGTKSAFTEGNVIADTLTIAPKSPSFNQLTVSFGNGELDFVNDAVSIAAADHAAMVGGAVSPQITKADISLVGCSTRDEAGVFAATRLKEELGGATSAEWNAARKLGFKTTILALETEPGQVCSLTHPDLPANASGSAHEFRVQGWKLNRDYSIDISGMSVTDSCYDMLQGPPVVDVTPDPLPEVETRSLIPGDVNDLIVGRTWEDSQQITVPLKFKPPSPVGSFSAVRMYLRQPDSTSQAVDHGLYQLDPVDEGGYHNISVSVDKTVSMEPFKLYVVSCSKVYEKAIDLANTPHTDTITPVNTTAEMRDCKAGYFDPVDGSWTPEGYYSVIPEELYIDWEAVLPTPLVDNQTAAFGGDVFGEAPTDRSGVLNWSGMAVWLLGPGEDFGRQATGILGAPNPPQPGGKVRDRLTLAAKDVAHLTSPETWRLRFVSYDLDGKRYDDELGRPVGPEVAVTINPIPTLADIPAVTDFDAEVEYQVDASGNRQFRFVASATHPAPNKLYDRCCVTATWDGDPRQDIILGYLDENGQIITDWWQVYDPNDVVIRAYSENTLGQRNTTTVPSVTLTVEEQLGSDSSGKYAPNVTDLEVETVYSTSADGVEMYGFVGSWTQPADQSTWRGVRIYFVPHPFSTDRSTWIALADETTALKTDHWPIQNETETATIVALSYDASNRENPYHGTSTPKVDVLIELQTDGALKGDRLLPQSVVSGKIADGAVTDQHIDYANVALSSFSGTLSVGQANAVNVANLAGTLSVGQANAISISNFAGNLDVSRVANVNTLTIGSFAGNLDASRLNNLGALNIGSMSGSISIGSISNLSSFNVGSFTGVIVNSQIAAGMLSDLTKFAADLRPITRVASLPSLPNAAYPVNTIVLNLADSKLYKNNSGTWTVVTARDTITGSIASTDIISVAAGTIIGAINAANVNHIQVSQFAGTLSVAQANAVTISNFAGNLDVSRVANLNTLTIGSFAGNLDISRVANLGTVNINTFTGSISSINAGTVTLTGQWGNSHISSIAASKLTAGTISAAVTMTSPTIQVFASGLFTVDINSTVGVRVTSAAGTVGSLQAGYLTVAAFGYNGLYNASNFEVTGTAGKITGWTNSSTYLNVYNASNTGVQITPNGITCSVANASLQFTGSGQFVAAASYRFPVVSESVGLAGLTSTYHIPVYNSAGTYVGKIWVTP